MKTQTCRQLLFAIFFNSLSGSIFATSIDLSTAPGFTSYQYPGSSVTTVTGIRDRNITGNFSTTGGDTGGLLFDSTLSNSTASAYPTATQNLSNFPGAISSTPYGPSFGSSAGILRVVGSYKTAASANGAAGDLGYFSDAATGTITTLLPTSLAGGSPILNTIAHSNFGNQVVGNFDTQLSTGNSFIYNTATGSYSSVPFVGHSFAYDITAVASNTAYGVYNNLISGGYTGTYHGTAGTYAYIYNQSSDKVYTFSSPDGSLVTHFEGITSAGKPGIYNLVADAVDVAGNKVKAYVATVDLNSIDGTTGQPKITWTEIKVGSSLTSANSMYQGNVIGVYVQNGITTAYEANIGNIAVGTPATAIYDPITNSGNRLSTLSGNGGDVINSGSITTNGSNGIQSGSSCGYDGCATATQYGGVISNYGTVSVIGGSGSSAALMQGSFGTLVNYGTLRAAAGDYAIKTTTATDASASVGSLIVNGAGGIIDGQVSIAAGPYARFENSGWMGIGSANTSAPGIVNTFSGTFVQTSTGTLGLRISPAAVDQVIVSGTAKLGGALSLTAIAGTYGAARYSLVNATGGLSGTFSSFSTNLASATKFTYDSNNAYINVYAFTTAETQQSLVNTSAALQNTFTLQNSVLANSFTYDCNVFGANDVCVSAGGRNTAVSAANGLNNTSALLIAAYRLSPNYRIGAYADQNLSVNNAGSTVNLGNNTPLIGLFGAWNERLDGTGTEVKVSAAYGQKNTTVTRQVVGTSEPGSGSSQLNSQGAQITAKYGFGVTPDVIVAPYVGMRYTQNNMGGYTEQATSSVTAPLTYSALNTNATTALAGVGAQYKLTPQATAFASAGVETDTNTSNGTYSATGLNNLTPINFNANPIKTRPTATLGAYYDIEKNQRLGIAGIYRQEPYQAVQTTTVMATYTVGL
ncbi:autotransporter outer membrane beta-barrel domain-containing protein [Polynucleobacter sp. UK-Kesae-W10]|uniref:beta strand repeat-containing protein n=1 Tax=Polynucleobacter sp. UK-Kesae-W10 TaxID=1819738 RepID=UPI001C0D9298|nr:autotransporter outer membrane beta-barrel domain-containing protein [Polynucleobacter sp. UK-Kesae-W10]MBU3577668.1 autotransporter outer membrane beta-barrel domain-containing protein [Polynucleobacter sp. UK-Kesae-W10]